MSEFRADKSTGRIAELIFALVMERRGWKVVSPVRHPLFQSLDIDHVAENPEGFVITADSKGETRSTGNLFFETTSNDNKGTEGWGYTSKADRIAHVNLAEYKIYIYSLPSMREHVEGQNYRCVAGGKTHFNGVLGYQTWGLLVPVTAPPVTQVISFDNGTFQAAKNLNLH